MTEDLEGLKEKDIAAIAEAWVEMVVKKSAESGAPEVPEEGKCQIRQMVTGLVAGNMQAFAAVKNAAGEIDADKAVAVIMAEGENQQKNERARYDILMLDAAIKAFSADCGAYPTTEQGLAALAEAPTAESAASSWDGPYDAVGARIDPWDAPYCYANPGSRTGKDYDLFSMGPDGESSDDDVFLGEDDHLTFTPA